jgi:chromosome partitioning protein
VIDLDPQATATKWGTRRAEDSERQGAEVVSAQVVSLPKLLREAREAGADLMILDTAPHADAMAVDAARVADYVLIPCRPAIADLEAVPASADIVRLASKPFGVVLNAVGAQGTRGNEARSELERLGLIVSDVEIGHRVAFADAMIPGQGVTEYRPGSPAAFEIETLFDWTIRQTDTATSLPIDNTKGGEKGRVAAA